MSESVWIAVVGALQAVTVAVVTVLGVKSNRRAKEAKAAVTNDHGSHIRDDLDGMAGDIRTVMGGQNDILRSLGSLWALVRRLDDRVEDVEQTIEPRERTTPGSRSQWAPPEGGHHDRSDHHPGPADDPAEGADGGLLPGARRRGRRAARDGPGADLGA